MKEKKAINVIRIREQACQALNLFYVQQLKQNTTYKINKRKKWVSKSASRMLEDMWVCAVAICNIYQSIFVCEKEKLICFWFARSCNQFKNMFSALMGTFLTFHISLFHLFKYILKVHDLIETEKKNKKQKQQNG